MAEKIYVVHALWDDEARVWVASSDNVPGLVTEAATMEALEAKLRVLVPELLELNGALPGDGPLEVPLHIQTERREIIRLRA